MADLVEDREAVVEEVVEDVVEEVAGALREEGLAQLGLVQAALEEPRDRQQLDGRQRDEVAGPRKTSSSAAFSRWTALS